MSNRSGSGNSSLAPAGGGSNTRARPPKLSRTDLWSAKTPSDSRVVKIFTRRGRNSSGGRRAVVGIEESLRAAYRLRGIVGHYLCPGDCVPRGSAPGTRPAPGQRSLPEQDQIGKAFLLTDRTQRSANAFRFGLRGGSARHLRIRQAIAARMFLCFIGCSSP